MASRTTGRTFRCLIQSSRPACEYASSRFPRSAPLKQFSVSAAQKDVKYENEKAERPRWTYTPERMKAPFSARIKDTTIKWECNNDPALLDRFYITFLGPGGDKLLTEEVKWLAITHKSYDQGRRGFNDRLAFLGRRIMNIQTNLALLHSSNVAQPQSQPISPGDDREPFTHPALEGLANLASVPIRDILEKKKIGAFATQMGMREIIRWQPKHVDRLTSSGVNVVMTSAIYAIIGAIALQRGGDFANLIARERVLKPLGIS